MKKTLLIIFGSLLSLILIVVATAAILFTDDLMTVLSLETYDAKYLYSIKYYGNYHFDEFLEVGAKDWKEYGAYVEKAIAHGIAGYLNIDDYDTGCSSFIARNKEGDVLFCRNFDYDFAPVVMTFTEPRKAYASLTACNLGFFDDFARKEDIIPHKVTLDNIKTLACPYFATDGMNEYGVAISILDSGRVTLPEIEDAPTMVTCSMVRMVLENAKTTDEAVELFKSYNISKQKPNHHFMIADASGKAVVMEYTKDGIIAYDSDIVTNFDLYDELHLGCGKDRYDYIQKKLEETGGVLSEEEAIDVLKHVAARLQYSTIYNLNTGEVHVFTRGDTDHVEVFNLTMSENR